MLTPKQRWFYFGLWREAKKILMNGRETWTKYEENLRRHELTVRALGRDKSSNDFTQRDFDKIIAELKAIVNPDDLNGQLRQQDMHTRRMQFGLRKLMRELGVGNAYVDAIVHQMNDHGELGSNRLDALDVDELRKVMIALRKHQQRGGGTVLARNYELRPA